MTRREFLEKYKDLINELRSLVGEWRNVDQVYEKVISIFNRYGIGLDDWGSWGELALIAQKENDLCLWGGWYTGPYASPEDRAYAFAGIWENISPAKDPTEAWDDWEGIYVYQDDGTVKVTTVPLED